MSVESNVFKNGSTTYYWSSKFFPPEVRDDVFDLYSFVRIADDYVDQVPADKEGFYRLRRMLMEARKSITLSTAKRSEDTIDERVVKNIIRLQQDYNFEWQWIDAFLDAMQSDLVHEEYKTLEDSLQYVYGSAEVIGLMMAKIMGLPIEAADAARMQGRAMQWINFIRDVAEDNTFGRCYFPSEDLVRFGLKDVTEEVALHQTDNYQNFINFQLERYAAWQAEAETGYKYIPKRLRIPLMTASNMYNWTGNQILKRPEVVFERKIKPSKTRVIGTVLKNIVK